MRIAIMIAALGIVTAAPMFAPTTLLPQAEAQTADAASALEAELLAAAGDATAIQAIITREQGAGNSAGLARALAKAATTLAATDVTGAADLVSQAVSIAAAVGDSTVSSEVGAAASTVASTAVARGDGDLANAISQQIALNSTVEIASSYVNSGGTAGSVVPQGGDTDTGGEIPPVITPTGDNTPDDVPSIPPSVPDVVVVPEVPEPNPSQAGSPV